MENKTADKLKIYCMSQKYCLLCKYKKICETVLEVKEIRKERNF